MEISTLLTVLLVLGIVIILISLASFFVPALKTLSVGRQHFKGFGIELEINTIALTLLLGILLTLPGFYLYIKDYEDQVKALNSSIDQIENESRGRIRKIEIENEGLKDIVEGGKRYDINAILQFKPNEAPPFGSIKNLECSYTTWKGGDPIIIKPSDVQPGPSEGSIEVRIKGLDREDFIVALTVKNKMDNTMWSYDKPFKPAKPSIEMTKKTQ